MNDLWEVPDERTVPAEWFRRHGINVFPVHGKDPAVPKGTSWKNWQGPVGRDFGVELCARLGVLDTDNRDDEHWVLHQIVNNRFRDTPFFVNTARGVHRYYRLSGALPKFIHRDGHTIEFRNEGQYVVGPGSRHPSGVIYTAASWSWRWEDIPLFPADFRFVDGSYSVSTSTPGTPYEIPDAAVSAGQRHYELFRFLRHVKSFADDKAQAREYVLWFNQQRCRPPLAEDDAFARWFDRAWNQRDRPFPLPVTPLQGLRGL